MVFDARHTRPESVGGLGREWFRSAGAEDRADDEFRPLLDREAALGGVDRLFEEIVLLFLDQTHTQDQRQLLGGIILHMQEAGIGIGRQIGFRVQVERRAGHDAVDGEFQPVV